MVEHWLAEFWRQGYNRRVPGFPVALLRVSMGIFWFSQPVGAGLSVMQRILLCLTGILLAIGLLAKLGSLLGITLTAWHLVQFAVPLGEPLWPYVLLIIIHVLLLTTSSGRCLGLDQVVVEKIANWPGGRSHWLKRILFLF